jgi:hypothetical protein
MLKNLFPILTFLFFCYSYSFAQEQQSNSSSVPGQKVELTSVDHNAFTFVPPPTILPLSERAATINVTYTGFSTEAQIAFQYAVDIWESLINSNRIINIDATWAPADPNNLGSAGASSYWPNFSGAPNGNTYYPQALAESICNCSLANPDINANFNSNRTDWYFGTDGNTPAGEYDFVSVVLHEIGHGLGFAGSGSVDGAGVGSLGLGPNSWGTIYDLFVINNTVGVFAYDNPSTLLGNVLQGSGNLLWNGTNGVAGNDGDKPELFDPATFNPGSSYSHFDETYFPAGHNNSLMTPNLSGAEAIHHPGESGMGLLQDLGWSVNSSSGCTDPDACNFDLTAIEDDGSCSYFWYLPDVVSDGPAIEACSAPDNYHFAVSQSCAEYVISDDAYCEYNNWDSVCEAAYNCCEDTDNHGCTIDDACNYDADACWNDGSCFSCITGYSCFNLTISGGGSIFPADGVWELIGSDGDVEATGDYYFSTFSAGYLEIDLCVPEDCYTFQIIPELLTAGVSWDIGFEGVLFSGSTNDTASLSSAGAGGCMNIIACNYDEFACFDDGSCDYYSPSVFLEGIEDYTWLLQTDFLCDGQYSSGSWVELLADHTYITEGGNEGTWSACDSDFSLLSDGGSLYTGSVSLFTDHFIEGTYNSNPGGGFAIIGCFKMTSITLGCTDLLACNYSESATYDDGTCTYPGCEDPLACNYLMNPGCLESCIYPEGQILGCTYPTAYNYDPNNNVDDGTCVFDLTNPDLCGTGTYFDAVTGTCLPDGTGTGDGCPGDLDDDGFINTNDLLAFLAVYGTACP